jgi:hypothetical protein
MPNQYKPKYKPVHDYVTGELNLDSLLKLLVDQIKPKPQTIEDISDDILYELFNIAVKSRFRGNYVDFIIVLEQCLEYLNHM